jgi:multiple antibiotic resistance protein
LRDLLTRFGLAFIPLFVAIDVAGVLPVFAALTEGMQRPERGRVIRDACVTALGVSVAFACLGEGIFHVLGVTASDFRIAGGILLLVFAVQDLMIGGKPRRVDASATVGVVPLGMPLIVGPGTLTTVLLVLEQQGYPLTLAALAVNLAIVLLVLRASERLMRLLGPGGSIASAKIASLFLATIGVMMVRVGILDTIRGAGG